MSKSKKTSFSLFGWILTHRLLFIIIALLSVFLFIAVPTAYITTYNRYKVVEFSETDKRTNFQSLEITQNDDELDVMLFENEHLKLVIELYDFYENQYKTETNGHYTFKFFYTSKKESSSMTITNVNADVIVKADWVDAKSSITSTSIYHASNGIQRRVDFNYKLESPLWFVNLDRPNFYMKLSYDVTVNGLTTPTVFYLSHSLNHLPKTSI